MSHKNEHHDHDHSHHQEHDHSSHGHSHGHSQGNAHAHSHTPENFGRAFAIGIALNSIFIIVEIIYGLSAHSLALIADAGHNLSDVLGLFLAWGATVLAKRAASKRYTYGLQRTSILVAIFNAVFLLVSVGAIAWESVQRLHEPAEISTQTVIWVAILGICINSVTAFMFMSGRKSDLNIRGAYLHMASDAVISAGVVLAACVIYFTHWLWLDPLISLVISGIIILGTWSLLRDSINLSLDAVPQNIDLEKVKEYFLAIPTVTEIHHLHIWGLSTTEIALTVHIVIDGDSGSDFLHKINTDLKTLFRISHATIQCESNNEYKCGTPSCK